MFKILLPISTAILTAALVLLPDPSSGNPGLATVGTGSPVQESATTSSPGGKNPIKPTAESQAKAKKTYGFDCALCHAENGSGKTDLAKDMQLSLSDLSDPKSLAGKTDGDIFQIIRNGKDKMPPEAEDRAKDAEIWNLVIYVRSLAKNQSASSSQ